MRARWTPVPDWTILVPVAFYLVVVFGIGFYASRTAPKDEKTFMEEYFIGSRSFGGFVLAMTFVATYISASSYVGGPGAAYRYGLGWVFLAMIQLPTAVLTLSVLGKKFAIVGRRINAVTLNDFLRRRYESKTVVILGALCVLAFFSAAMSAQFIGGARLFEVLMGVPYRWSLSIFAVTVVAYTTIGGFRAVALTDAIQGVVMLVGVVIALFGIVNLGGGMESIIMRLKETDPGLITPFGPDGFITKPFLLSFWVLVGFAVIGLPQSAVRCMAYRDSKSLHRGIVYSTVSLGFILLVMHFTGAIGQAIIPGLEVGDRVVPTMVLQVMPPVIAGIFIAGPVASIMSTIDSQLILASAAIVKDLYLNYINPDAGKRGLMQLSIAFTALLGVVVFMVSLNPPPLLIWINLFAFGGLEAAFLWPTVLGLYWRRGNATGALASMIVGVGTYVTISQWKIALLGPRVNAVVPTLLLSLIAFVVVSLLTPKPKEEIVDLFFRP